MEIGRNIKMFRLQRGITQEAMAQHLGITSQAVSKWERGAASPDIEMLPAISAYFGVTIDDLFALSDDTRMERIQNMLYDVRVLDPLRVEDERKFLLEKAAREPENGMCHEMLANLEIHLAQEHNERAEEYALEAIRRNPDSCRAHTALAHAMGGSHVDPRNNTHNALIDHYKRCIEKNPQALTAYPWLIEQLIDDGRLKEARRYCEQWAQDVDNYYMTVHWIKLALAEGDRERAKELWEQMGAENPQNWSVWHWIGDFQTQAGDYAAAKQSYRKAMELQTVPHYEDPDDSLAQVCEMDGDFAGAIAARKEQLRKSVEEWEVLSGESVDYIRRELERLKKRL